MDTTDKAAAIRAKIGDSLEALGMALEAGKSDALRAYLAFAGKFHRYSMGNQILIALQCPGATRVAGFRAWLGHNRYVRKGEKGIAILAPMVFRKREAGDPAPAMIDGRDVGARRERSSDVAVRFRVVHVFDVSQTDGEAIPEYSMAGVAGDPAGALDRLRAFVGTLGRELVHEDTGSAMGLCSPKKISIRPGLTPADEFQTLAHECAHAMLHQGEGAERGSRARCEMEAEAVAYVVACGAGLEPGSLSSDYLSAFGADRKALTASLERIRGAAGRMLEAVVDKREEAESLAA